MYRETLAKKNRVLVLESTAKYLLLTKIIRRGSMLVSDFMSFFVKRLYETVPEEVKRDLMKQDRAIKHGLYMVMGKYQRIRKDLAMPFQEKFHMRMDQLAADYRTWKSAGCKAYARPKQYISGPIAGVAKKAFDHTLGTFLLELKKEDTKVVPIIEKGDISSWDEFSEEAS